MPDAQDYRFWFDCVADAYFVFHFLLFLALFCSSFLPLKKKKRISWCSRAYDSYEKTIININNMWIIAMSLWWRMISLFLSPYQLYFSYFYCQLIFSDLRKNKPLRCLSSFVCVFTSTTYLCTREILTFMGERMSWNMQSPGSITQQPGTYTLSCERAQV